MENLESLALKYVDGRLLVLDQRLLPFHEKWIHCRSPQQMCEIIRTLQVRGAPLIGIAAGLAVADYARGGATALQVMAAAEKLLASRPTAVNLRAALDRLVFANPDLSPATIARGAVELFREDRDLCETMADYGAALIDDGDNLLTHCNTGSLVTTGIGTALGAIRRAWDQGKRVHVFIDETRPLLQGARLTTWELENAGIPHTLICDNMAAALMRQGEIDKVFVGADRIAANGDVANKIGTYSVAVCARHHDLPFYVVAPHTTVDLACPHGGAIPIEARDPAEVRGYAGTAASWAPDSVTASNPAFDVTPTALVSAIILDKGVFRGEDIATGELARRLSTNDA